VQKLLSCIPSDGTTVDLQDLFHKLTMDTSTDFLTGSGTDCLGGDEQGEKFASTFEKCLQDGIWKDMLGWLYYLTPRKEARDAVKYAHTAVEGWVKQAMDLKRSSEMSQKAKDRGERYVFVNELARHEEVDATRVRDETMNILLAGRDTTASLLSNLWFVLAREPEIYKKLQAEVDELKGEQPSYETLRNMKYIKYCVQESKQSDHSRPKPQMQPSLISHPALRLYPPVPILAKLALRDTVLPHGGGPSGLQPLFVPQNARVVYNSYSMMRQTSAFGPDASEFRPERWADPALRPGWSFLPFGGGPRVCLGQQYALTETYYVTIRIMQRFRRLECRDPEPWREKVSVTCCSFGGTKVGFGE
jgi:cytochrome P450